MYINHSRKGRFADPHAFNSHQPTPIQKNRPHPFQQPFHIQLPPTMADTQEPLLVRLKDYSKAWECDLCCTAYEDHATHKPWVPDEDCLVCETCIATRFEEALAHDIDYPARWGQLTLHAHHFPFLSPDLLARYEAKVAEITAHRATAKPEIPDGQRKGWDYQFCPVCKNAVALKDGCNHIGCTCGASFCFICGEVAFEGSGHWGQRGCPLYNREGMAGDDVEGGEGDDDDDDSDESDAHDEDPEDGDYEDDGSEDDGSEDDGGRGRWE